MTKSVSLLDAVQVLMEKPVGDGTVYFNALSLITDNNSPELIEGQVGPVAAASILAKVILEQNFADLAQAVESELKPSLENIEESEAVQKIASWAAKNTGRFPETLGL